MTACPDDDRLVEYVEMLLSPDERGDLEAHVDRCAACRQLLARFATGSSSRPADDPDLARSFVGQVAAGRYTIVDILGAGSMAIVYAAHDRTLDRRVALKLLRSEDPEHQARLAREGRVMARLAHPNVLAVHDVGTIDGRMFLTAELVTGQDVATWLRAEPRSWREIAGVFAQAARGLAVAHAAGVVHRDFKPSNMLLGTDGRVRVADFGLASSRERLEPALTRSGLLVGTPVYMAPELLAGGSADARSDQFAFCASLFEALHGARPFQASSVSALRLAIAHPRRVAPRRAPPHGRVDARVERVIERGLALDPAARATSMDGVAHELERAAGARASWRGPVRGLGVAALGTIAVVLALWRGDATPPPPAVAAIDLDDAPVATVAGRLDAGAAPVDAARPRAPRDAGRSLRRAEPSRAPDAATPDTATPDTPARGPAPPALLAAIRSLGYAGVTMDDDFAGNLGELRAQLAQVPVDDRGDAVRLGFALGSVQRRQGDCTAALETFRAALREGVEANRRNAELGRASNDWRIWFRRAGFAIGLCNIEQGALDDGLARIWTIHQGTPFRQDRAETMIALGMMWWHYGNRSDAVSMYLRGAKVGDAGLRTMLRTWATAVGAPHE